MQVLVDILKSRGKLGGALLTLLGVTGFVLTATDVFNVGYTESAAMFAAGLSLFGIRAAQDK